MKIQEIIAKSLISVPNPISRLMYMTFNKKNKKQPPYCKKQKKKNLHKGEKGIINQQFVIDNGSVIMTLS